MIVENKLQSINLIKKLNLNRFPEQLFHNNQEKEVINFLNRYPARYYAIRDRSISKGLFKLKVKKEDVLDEIRCYDLFSINVSSINYVDNQIMCGELEILDSGEIYGEFSCNPHAIGRPSDPDTVIVKTDIFNSSEINKIPNFDYIYDYFVRHKLLNVIVELALFDTDVGINNERVIIYELRTHY